MPNDTKYHADLNAIIHALKSKDYAPVGGVSNELVHGVTDAHCSAWRYYNERTKASGNGPKAKAAWDKALESIKYLNGVCAKAGIGPYMPENETDAFDVMGANYSEKYLRLVPEAW